MSTETFRPYRKRLAFLFVLVAWICFPTKSLFAAPASVTTYQSGWIDRSGPYPVLHISGSEKEMGEQYGYLAGDLVKANIENLIQVTKNRDPKLFKWFPDGLFTFLRRAVGLLFWNKFPKENKDHILGIIEGAKKRPDKIKINKFDLAFLNSIIDLVGITDGITENIARLKAKLKKGNAKKERPSLTQFFDFLSVPHFTNQCDTFAAWGPRTVQGKTFQTRNTDLDTGEGLEKYPLVIIFKKSGKIPIAAASFAGMTGVFAGMNAYGVSLGQVWGFSYDIKINTPWQIVTRNLFSEAQTAEEVARAWEKIGSTTYGTNFIYADSGELSHGQKVGYAVEASGKYVASFHGNDPKEKLALVNGEQYSMPLENAIARADFSMDQKMRLRSYGANGPKGDPRTTGSYRLRYQGQIDRIIDYEKQGILIGQPEAETISRETAARDGNLHNSVYANTDREMWVAVARVLPDGTVRQAYEEPYIHVPFNQHLIVAQAKGHTGEIAISRWAPTAPKNVLLVVSRGNQVIDQRRIFVALTSVTAPVSTQPGDIIEIYDTAGTRLLDRTIAR
ncbi:MAG: hypothetical protein JNL01_11185 [Bdellovibrionales bacterium]|nr:hypothetical protein [Bdellovibrionales bacterium]